MPSVITRLADVPDRSAWRLGAGPLAEVPGLPESVIEALQREYPNDPHHALRKAGDVRTPRQIHPAFYGCFDWHSAVHMHWTLIRLVQTMPDAPWTDGARNVLDQHLTESNLQLEARYLELRPGYELPYGRAWLLELAGLADNPWSERVAGTAAIVERQFIDWLSTGSYPDRAGVHSNTAFALARSLPYARTRPNRELHTAIETAARRWFGSDRDYPSGFEPGPADFVSPTLSELVLMHEVLEPAEFESWFTRFNGGIVPTALAEPVDADGRDGRGTHLLGLNLYRIHALRELGFEPSDRLRAAGELALSADGWMAQHWLATFALLANGG